jgi:hypothetical protein
VASILPISKWRRLVHLRRFACHTSMIALIRMASRDETRELEKWTSWGRIRHEVEKTIRSWTWACTSHNRAAKSTESKARCTKKANKTQTTLSTHTIKSNRASSSKTVIKRTSSFHPTSIIVSIFRSHTACKMHHLRINWTKMFINFQTMAWIRSWISSATFNNRPRQILQQFQQTTSSKHRPQQQLRAPTGRER